jgi:hypothetical protein
MGDPCFLKWICSPKAALQEPRFEHNNRPIKVSNRSTPWVLPPDSNLPLEYRLNCLLHDAELPTKMLDHLAELMRADYDAFNRQTVLDTVENNFNFLKHSISSTNLDPGSEASTTKVTTPIIETLLRHVADELNIQLKVEPQKREGVKEIDQVLDWHVIQGPDVGRVAVCWEDKSEVVFNKWIEAIIDGAKNHKQYPANYWEETITDSVGSIMGKVQFAPRLGVSSNNTLFSSRLQLPFPSIKRTGLFCLVDGGLLLFLAILGRAVGQYFSHPIRFP